MMAQPIKLGDGSTMTELENGNKLFRSPSGTLRTTKSDGETVVLEQRTDGTKIECFDDGSVKQTNPDGVEITQLANGVGVVQFDPKTGIKISKMQGVTIQEDPSLKAKVMIFPDGYRMYELEDGTTVDVAPDGSRKTTLSDDVTIETFDDGSRVVTHANGKVRRIPPPHMITGNVSEKRKIFGEKEKE